MTKTEKELEILVKPVVQQLGYELYDLEFLKEGTEWFLRLYIEVNGKSIDLEDCERVSNAVSDLLDEKDPIATAYHLEVSSCGLEKNLREVKHFEAALHKQAEFKLYKPYEGKKTYIGQIMRVTGEQVTILDDNGMEIPLALANISSAKTLFNWEE